MIVTSAAADGAGLAGDGAGAGDDGDVGAPEVGAPDVGVPEVGALDDDWPVVATVGVVAFEAEVPEPHAASTAKTGASASIVAAARLG